MVCEFARACGGRGGRVYACRTLRLEPRTPGWNRASASVRRQRDQGLRADPESRRPHSINPRGSPGGAPVSALQPGSDSRAHPANSRPREVPRCKTEQYIDLHIIPIFNILINGRYTFPFCSHLAFRNSQDSAASARFKAAGTRRTIRTFSFPVFPPTPQASTLATSFAKATAVKKATADISEDRPPGHSCFLQPRTCT